MPALFNVIVNEYKVLIFNFYHSSLSLHKFPSWCKSIDVFVLVYDIEIKSINFGN